LLSYGLILDDGLSGMYGPPHDCKRNVEWQVVCANVYGL
jgi:hypothetical protein